MEEELTFPLYITHHRDVFPLIEEQNVGLLFISGEDKNDHCEKQC